MANSKRNTIPKTQLSTTDISLETRDVQLIEAYIKNQEKRNKLHQKETELLSKKGKLTTTELAQLEKIYSAYERLTNEASKLHAVTKKLDDTQANIKKNVETSVDAWSSLSSVYKSSKTELQNIALDSLKLKDVSASIASSENYTNLQRKKALEQISAFSDGMASISLKASELAGLSEEDVEKRAILKSRITDEIGLYEQQVEKIKQKGKLDKRSIEILENIIKGKKDELAVADDLSSQSKLQKEIQEELRENLKGMQKTILKVKDGVKMFLSSWQGAVGVIAYIVGQILDGFGKIGKSMGVGLFTMVGIKTEALLIDKILGETAGKAVLEMAKNLGNVNKVTLGSAIDAGTLAANYDLSAEQAGYLATEFGYLSGNSQEVGNNTREYAKQLAIANGVMPAAAFQDMAQNSEFIAKYTDGTGKNIGKAAVAAGVLGINLATAAKLTDHLLDYQTSVQDEMEASVLLGKNINLNKARELAYNGDIEGSMKEALNAVGGIAEFNKMDYYQRLATAKALGVSVDELQKMAAHQQDLNGMNGVGNQIYSRTAELLQYMGNTIGGKLAKGFGLVIQGAGAMNLALMGTKYSVGGLVVKMWDGVKAMGMWVAESAKLGVSKIANLFGMGGSNMVADKTGKMWDANSPQGKMIRTKGGTVPLDAATKKTKDLGGSSISKGATEASTGTKAFDVKSMLIAAAAIVLFAVALYILVKAFQGFNTVEWSSLGKAAVVIGTLGLALKLFTPQLIAISSALTAASEVLVPAAGILLLFGTAIAVTGYGLKAFSEAFTNVVTGISSMIGVLPQLAKNMAPLLNMITPMFGLAAAITAVSVALIALGAASTFAMPVLAVMGFAAGAGNAIFGGGKESSSDKLLEQITGLREDLTNGKVAVLLDGVKVNTQLQKVKILHRGS
jgi:hypothetical protein